MVDQIYLIDVVPQCKQFGLLYPTTVILVLFHGV